MKTIQATTEALLKRYSGYPSARDYFRAYTLTGDALSGLPLPTTLLTAADDPIIPVRDFQRLSLPRRPVSLCALTAGHNGFLEGIRLRSRYEKDLSGLVRQAAFGGFRNFLRKTVASACFSKRE
ncbi:MAG: hypothetical protein MZV70_28850 [Desulfobacterales bacterium]|nr:hypothetical protein [Desulfobacterales bacterium]